MVDRKIEKAILSEGIKYPVITITGPRQSGKTTLARKIFPDYGYVNLEELATRSYAKSDPAGFFKTYEPPLIIDEIQNCPELLSQVQVMSDTMDEQAQFVITGSQQLSLSQAISQSLAGRTSIFTLLPFSISEISAYGKKPSAAEHILHGGMPRVYEKRLRPETYYRDYIQTYLERDVRQLVNVKNLSKFEKFLIMLAARTGSTINLSSLCDDTGVSSVTLKEWLSALEASHIAFTLMPWFENIGKRLVKTPKIYFTDTGVACSLLSITSAARLETDRMYGRLFENLVIGEALKARYNSNRKPELSYLRTESRNEIDLLDASDGQIVPYEIKSSATFNPEFLKQIEKCGKFLNYSNQKKGGVIYAGETLQSFNGYKIANFREVGEIF